MDIMYECMIVCMCVPEFMGRLNQGPNPQGNLQICYAGVCARNCALANPKVPQNPSCHTSKPPQQQRGVSKIIPASGRKGSPGLAWIIPAWGGAPPWGRNPFLPQGGRDSAPRQESRNPPKRFVLATQ